MAVMVVTWHLLARRHGSSHAGKGGMPGNAAGVRGGVVYKVQEEAEQDQEH